MTNRTEDSRDPTKYPLVMRVTDNDFQCEVLEKLARLEAWRPEWRCYLAVGSPDGCLSRKIG